MSKKDDFDGWTADEIATYKATERAHSQERRRQSRSPHGIEMTNRKKRNGNMSFGLTKDGRTFILQMVTNNPAAALLLKRLQQLDPKLVKRFTVGDKGKQQIEIAVQDPVQTLKLAGCKPVPEKCARCEGHGALNIDGSPSWSIHIGGGGATACPICKGSGRALPDPTESWHDEQGPTIPENHEFH